MTYAAMYTNVQMIVLSTLYRLYVDAFLYSDSSCHLDMSIENRTHHIVDEFGGRRLA